jgi:hypothetical protein
MLLTGELTEHLARIALNICGRREHAAGLGERSTTQLTRPGVNVLENEAMDLLKLWKVVRSVEPARGELRDSECACLRLAFREREGVSQLCAVSEHGGARVHVGVSHCAWSDRAQCGVDAGSC